MDGPAAHSRRMAAACCHFYALNERHCASRWTSSAPSSDQSWDPHGQARSTPVVVDWLPDQGSSKTAVIFSAALPSFPSEGLIRPSQYYRLRRLWRAPDTGTDSPAQFDIVSRRGGSVSVLGSIAVSTPLRYETSAFSASTP